MARKTTRARDALVPVCQKTFAVASRMFPLFSTNPSYSVQMASLVGAGSDYRPNRARPAGEKAGDQFPVPKMVERVPSNVSRTSPRWPQFNRGSLDGRRSSPLQAVEGVPKRRSGWRTIGGSYWRSYRARIASAPASTHFGFPSPWLGLVQGPQRAMETRWCAAAPGISGGHIKLST